jgi:SPP1 gp7 family putative phage head morphogenesis protein
MSKIRINRRKDYKEQLKLYLNLSKSLNAKTKKLFKKTARQAEKEYLKYEDMYYFFLEDFSNDFYKILSNHYRAVITASGERLIKQREKKAESEIDIAVAKYINDVTATKVTEVSETTKQSIRRSIKKGIADGESIPTISKDIRQNNAFKPYRATMIARTETHSAMNYGNDEISKTLGFKDPVKEWNSALDDRTRQWHRAMNGTVVKQDEMFKVMTPIAGGGFTERRMNYTGDYQNGGALNVINCRCFTLRYDSEDEVIGATPKPVSPVVPEVPTENPIPEGTPLSIGVNPTSFTARIAGSKLVIEDKKQSLKEIKTKIKNNEENFDYNRMDNKWNWLDKNSGKVTPQINKYSARDLTELNVVIDELDQLADFYKISRIRGITSVRGNGTANMGGGVMGIKKDYYDNGEDTKFLMYKKKFMIDDLKKNHTEWANQNVDFAELSKYKIGKTKFYSKNNPSKRERNKGKVYHGVSDYEIPADLDKYGDVIPENILNDMSMAQKRSVSYHEFGHHVHQSLETTGLDSVTEQKLADFYVKAVNSKKQRDLLAQGKTSLYPSRYSQANSKEWFAENFSAYHMGRNDIVSPEWLEFYKTEILPNIK